MDTVTTIERAIEERSLLTHPFYTKWVAGTLPIDAIRDYARQYYAFESSFPRFLSAIHSRCQDRATRQMLLDNLWDEEHGRENHAELWLRFAEGVGVTREEVLAAAPNTATQALVETYRRTATEEAVVAGVAAIHAYERQVPDVATAKIDGLRRHYGVADERTLAFWEIHRALDVAHAEAERRILGDLAASDPGTAQAATEEALDAWWAFLSAVDPV
ncbi:MAG: CADD family putative folate metabolism protein [Actinomycetota bacterium]